MDSAKKQKYAVGEEVLAKVKGWKQHYKGKVTAFDAAAGTYAIEFEDGDKKEGVKGFNIKPVAKQETFTAPDGKTFQDKRSYRKYLQETFYSFKDKTEQVLEKKAGDIAGQTFSIANLKKCTVRLADHSDQVLVDDVDDCNILVGPSSDSVFVRKAKNCHFFIACKQFRCRDCVNCKVSLYSKTEPVIETSTNMQFYPYMCAYPGQTEHFKKANLQPEHNHWCNVFDFNKRDANIPEPHWILLPEEQGWEKLVVGEENKAENPVPRDARAVVVPKETGFSLELSQADAQKAFEQQQEQGGVAAPAAPAAPPAVAAASTTPESAGGEQTSSAAERSEAAESDVTKLSKQVAAAKLTGQEVQQQQEQA